MGHVLMVGMVLEWKDIWYGYWVVIIFVMLLSTLVTLSDASHERERKRRYRKRERGDIFIHSSNNYSQPNNVVIGI